MNLRTKYFNWIFWTDGIRNYSQQYAVHFIISSFSFRNLQKVMLHNLQTFIVKRAAI